MGNKSYVIAGGVILLLVVVGMSHQFMGMTANDIAANKPKGHDHSHDHEHEGAEEGKEAERKIELPAPMGKSDAPVRIAVYVTTDNECDTTTLAAMDRVAKRFGEKVYITFADLLRDEVLQEAQAAKISCKSGLTINGKSKFILPERGLKGTVLLDGPVGEKNYNMGDVEAVVEHLLKAGGGEKKDKGSTEGKE